MSREFAPPFECPVCGEEVPPGAKACPGCGADERTGWDEDAARYDGLDLPDEAFEEGETRKAATAPGRAWFWPVVVLFVLAAVIVTLVFQ